MKPFPFLAALPLAIALLIQAAPSPAQDGAVAEPLTDPDQVLAAFAPGPGREETAAACGACHAPSLITGKKLNAEAWAQTVDQMIGRGAQVADKDYDVIVEYLAHNYGPEKS